MEDIYSEVSHSKLSKVHLENSDNSLSSVGNSPMNKGVGITTSQGKALEDSGYKLTTPSKESVQAFKPLNTLTNISPSLLDYKEADKCIRGSFKYKKPRIVSSGNQLVIKSQVL